MTIISADKAAMIAANRRRYEELKAAGQGASKPLPLPPPSDRALANRLESNSVLQRETIPGGWYTTFALKRGEALRLLNTSGTPGVSILMWNADDTSERYNAGDTVKVQWSAELRKGRVLFSDMGRVMFSIVEDSCGAHDTLAGGSTPDSNAHKYGDASLRNTRENLVLGAGKHGLARRDVGPVITFFAPVAVDAEGRFVWRNDIVKAGDFVDLRAEMNLLVAISNCPHPFAPDKAFAPGSIEVSRFRAPTAKSDDLCRNATAEARRAFENTDPLFTMGAST